MRYHFTSCLFKLHFVTVSVEIYKMKIIYQIYLFFLFSYFFLIHIFFLSKFYQENESIDFDQEIDLFA